MYCSSMRNTQVRRPASLNCKAMPQLAGEPAAVNNENVSADVVAGGRGKEDGSPSDILRRTPSRSRYTFKDLSGACGVILQSLREVRSHVSGGDGVDLDAARRPLVGQRLGELSDTTFGCCVCGDRDAALKAEQRRDVNNLA